MEYRIFVGSISDYEHGGEHGVWITLTPDKTIENINDDIRRMLQSSPAIDEFGSLWPEPEWKIYDWEGFPYSLTGRSPTPEEFLDYVKEQEYGA